MLYPYKTKRVEALNGLHVRPRIGFFVPHLSAGQSEYEMTTQTRFTTGLQEPTQWHHHAATLSRVDGCRGGERSPVARCEEL